MVESVRLYIERLKEELGVETDEELADGLGYSKQAIANWRRRDKIPDKAVNKIVRYAGPAFARDEWEAIAAQRQEDAVLFACLTHVYKEFLDKYPDDLDPNNLLLLGKVIVEAKSGILDRIRDPRYHDATLIELTAYVSDIVSRKQTNMLTKVLFDYHSRKRNMEE